MSCMGTTTEILVDVLLWTVAGRVPNNTEEIFEKLVPVIVRGASFTAVLGLMELICKEGR